MNDAGSMQEELQLSKGERQRLVASLIERKRLGTQPGVVDGLEAAGCTVTQATVSRAIRELGLEKTRDPLGRLRYVLPNRERRIDPREILDSLLDQFGRRAVVAQNLVVVQAEIGSAPAIARALDRLADPLVIGTLAGDDTCLVIAEDADRAGLLADELSRSMN